MLSKLKHAWNNPMDTLYFIQGWAHWCYFMITNRIINKKKYLEKLKGASACVDNIECLECGCNTNIMLLSSKPCPKRKYSPEEKPCY